MITVRPIREGDVPGFRSALDSVGLEKVELSVYASNTPAIALCRKCGFVEEGRKRRGRLIDGAYDDVLLFALMLIEPHKSTDRKPGTPAPRESDGR